MKQKNIKNYSKIRNARDVKHQKKILNTKLKIRKHLLDKHINELNDDLSVNYVYQQSLKALKINNNVLSFLPRILKSTNTKNKGLMISLISAGIAGVASMLLFVKLKKKNFDESDDIEDEINE
ncbi:MAG: hypothetical protein U9Q83_03275 [Bacteroidota bacterium]|nr:hypothetical protein [Bacteroidota bacterium]